jgi:hypothetical protein
MKYSDTPTDTTKLEEGMNDGAAVMTRPTAEQAVARLLAAEFERTTLRENCFRLAVGFTWM